MLFPERKQFMKQSLIKNNHFMRAKIYLTDYQKQYIRDNYQQKTNQEIADKLGLQSRFLVQRFCSENNLERDRVFLSEEQKQYIRDNYKLLNAFEFSEELNIGVNAIQKFKREEGLYKVETRNKGRKMPVYDPYIFNVDARESWFI